MKFLAATGLVLVWLTQPLLGIRLDESGDDKPPKKKPQAPTSGATSGGDDDDDYESLVGISLDESLIKKKQTKSSPKKKNDPALIPSCATSDFQRPGKGANGHAGTCSGCLLPADSKHDLPVCFRNTVGLKEQCKKKKEEGWTWCGAEDPVAPRPLPSCVTSDYVEKDGTKGKAGTCIGCLYGPQFFDPPPVCRYGTNFIIDGHGGAEDCGPEVRRTWCGGTDAAGYADRLREAKRPFWEIIGTVQAFDDYYAYNK